MLSLSLAALSTPAYAHVEEVSTKTGGPKIKVGLQPREAEYFWYGSHKYNGLGKSESEPNHAAASFDNASGNAVVHTANTYAIYWDPQDYYHGDWQGLIDGFLANVGTAGSQLESPACSRLTRSTPTRRTSPPPPTRPSAARTPTPIRIRRKMAAPIRAPWSSESRCWKGP